MLSDQETVKFIDDSNSVINIKDEAQINFYVDRFMKILKVYYNVMRLMLNPDKTNKMVICKDWEIKVIINILRRTGFTFHAQLLRDVLDVRKHQDAGFEQPNNRFLFRLADCLHQGEESKIINKLTNRRYCTENLPEVRQC